MVPGEIDRGARDRPRDSLQSVIGEVLEGRPVSERVRDGLDLTSRRIGQGRRLSRRVRERGGQVVDANRYAAPVRS